MLLQGIPALNGILCILISQVKNIEHHLLYPLRYILNFPLKYIFFYSALSRKKSETKVQNRVTLIYIIHKNNKTINLFSSYDRIKKYRNFSVFFLHVTNANKIGRNPPRKMNEFCLLTFCF